MSVNMNDVKKLRNKTGAGFADCKKALDKANGNFEEAEKVLKEMGLAVAAKRGGRQTGEGSIFVDSNETHGAILELRCETDFVARNEEFQALGRTLLRDILSDKLTHITDALHSKVTELIGTIKENMEIKRFALIEKQENEIIAHYVHGKPGRLGAIVRVGIQDASLVNDEKFHACAHALALHTVARIPLYLSPDTVDEAYKNAQMEIFKTQVDRMEKPENIAAGIMQGKWKKHLDEVCFVLQPWVHDEKTKVHKELQRVSQEIQSQVCISDYCVFVLGDD